MDALWLVVILLAVVGIAGTVLPAIPGMPLVFGALLLGAWIDQFTRVSVLTVAVLGILTILALVVDYYAAAAGAKRAGAARLAVLGAVAGIMVGVFFGPPGIIIGPFVGAFLGQLLVSRDVASAGKAGVGTWIGLLIGTGFKLGIAIAMLIIFIAAYIL